MSSRKRGYHRKREMSTPKVILNPYAGRWKARENTSRVEDAPERAGMTYDLVVTQRADEGIDLAARAARAGFEPVVAVGGDSTCSEVINGLVGAAAAPTEGAAGLGQPLRPKHTGEPRLAMTRSTTRAATPAAGPESSPRPGTSPHRATPGQPPPPPPVRPG